MRRMTLRQIEAVRAVMLTGTIAGAADMLAVSAPGISRLIRYTEDSLGVRLFERRAGRFVPSVEAEAVFDQIGRIHRDVENLGHTLDALHRGETTELAIASAPSIAQFIAARAVRGIRRRFPAIYVDLNILKIEETSDYLLLERGEFVVMSSPVLGGAVESEPLVTGCLVAIVPEDHALATRDAVSVRDLADETLIGVDPDDPYGAQLVQPFRDAGIEPTFSLRGRFAQTVVGLVRHGLGVAVIDEFSVAEVYMAGFVRVPLIERTAITAHVARKKGRTLSSHAEHAIQCFREELVAATRARPWDKG